MDYETAQNYIAFAERAKAAVPVFVAMIAGKDCPMMVSAKEYDDTVEVYKEQIDQMFWGELREAKRVVEQEEIRARLEHEHSESTYYAPRRLHA